ncbi:MAG: hypothetical protein NW206_01770 [Hyphomonadaceae bacterium]|nr:hypothetical protein [Hyphomonadaceae bacterium]
MTKRQTPPDIITQLVTEFAIPVIEGLVRPEGPKPGLRLERSDRARFGFPEEGIMYAYNNGEEAVFLDLSGNRSQVWCYHQSAHGGEGQIEKAILAKYPQFKRALDEVRADAPDVRRRVLLGDLKAGRSAQVEINYPPTSANKTQPALLVVRVFALLDPQKAQAAAPLPQTKKGLN